MKFSDYLVVTNDGKVGNLLVKEFSDGTNSYIYITDIPNGESAFTAYEESEVELINKNEI